MKLPDFSQDATLEFDRNLEEGLYQTSRISIRQRRSIASPNTRPAGGWWVPATSRSSSECPMLPVPQETIQLLQNRGESYAPMRSFVRGDRRPIQGNAGDAPPATSWGDSTPSAPADAVAEDHTLLARFTTSTIRGRTAVSQRSELRSSDGVEVLFVGTFEELVRTVTMMMCKLMFSRRFLLKVTIFFPVACLTSFTVYVQRAIPFRILGHVLE